MVAYLSSVTSLPMKKLSVQVPLSQPKNVSPLSPKGLFLMQKIIQFSFKNLSLPQEGEEKEESKNTTSWARNL